ncbi:MAG: ribosome small subunit-dependent GTPase A, partial [Bacteroidales bacterium]|nr:ribosome small subunit-dependent GTPase A [Bacteroidales bacterium]
MTTGIVVKSVGSRYSVLLNSGKVIFCLLRGKLRVKGVETTNPVAVGDNVRVELTDDNKSGIITEVLGR